ncbi:MAG: hypothetical protein ABR548_15715 [Actinomycetota bacterium]|nr:hypothetical protein [Actinomycetota bacterium]
MLKKLFVCALAVAAVFAIASPASAAKPTKTTYSSATANAFWYFSDQLSNNTTRDVVWYIGAYRDDYGTWSDLYRTTTTCRYTGTKSRCTESFAYGAIDNANFTMASDLSSGHIDGTYVLEVYDANKRRSGTETVDAVTDLEGAGAIQTDSNSYTYKDDFISIRGTFTGSWRPAEADATVNGVSLGETYDANLSNSTQTETQRTK